ncbi:MAG: cysteine desulfurase [Lachnospiraceae bacterium]|jgi:cysteine desulfurase|nr:cysteine desulfurase [Lachnospiraceae bacterium]
MEVYLDNSATTKAYDEVAKMVSDIMCNHYGNPSSLHTMGVDAENIIKEAKQNIAKIWKVSEKEVFFTSGGTESDNLALRGAAFANKRAGRHIISSKIEHPAIINTCKYLEEEGFNITYLSVNSYGEIDLEELKNSLRDDTILVSIMHVNNEIGTIEPIEKIGEIVKFFNPKILFHVDDVQGFGKVSLNLKKAEVDLCSISSHKIHGPKGVGVLYIKNGTKINPIVFGGEQQGNIRSGTENVHGIAGIGLASKLIYNDLQEKQNKMFNLSLKLIKAIKSIPDTNIFGNIGEADFNNSIYEDGAYGFAPHIISAGFKDIRAEVLLHSLEEFGIYVSSGSACASNHPHVSSVLSSINAKREYLEATIRFSLSEFTTEEEIDYTISKLNEIVPRLRKYKAR